MPSAQLATYLQARADGSTVEEACALSTIGLREAELHEEAIASGELALPRARARARTREDQPKEEPFMARDNETTVQIGDGPKVPLKDLGEAADRISGQSVAADQLRLFIERIERLTEERKGIADDIADVYGEAKAMGYDKPTIRRIVRLRAMEPHHRQEAAALLETYAQAVGLQNALPL